MALRLSIPLALLAAGCGGRKSSQPQAVNTGRFEIPQVVVVAPVLETPAALYATFANGTDQPDTLLGLATPAAQTGTLHQMVSSGNQVMMQPLAALPIPAHTEVRLQPGGFHAMLDGLTSPLKPGDSVLVTLHLATRGDTTVGASAVAYADLEEALKSRR